MVDMEIANISLKWSLDKFSAPCWYFAQSLVDLYAVKEVNIGLIDTSVGGTKIEQWIQNKTGYRLPFSNDLKNLENKLKIILQYLQ